MKYHPLLTRRFLGSRFIPYAAVLAVAGGVFCLIPVLSVMEGFKVQIREQIRGSLSHIAVEGPGEISMYGELEIQEALEAAPNVAAVAPYVESGAIFKTHTIQQCKIRGIYPELEAKVGDFQSYVLRRSETHDLTINVNRSHPGDRQPMKIEEIQYLFSLSHRQALQRAGSFRFGPQTDSPSQNEKEGFAADVPAPPILVGIEAIRAGLMRIGQTLQFSSFTADGRIGSSEFMVVGAFKTGVYLQDISGIYMPFESAQNFLQLHDERSGESYFSGFSVRLDNYAMAKDFKKQIRLDGLAHYHGDELFVRTWEEVKGNLLQAVDIEKKIISVMMMLVIMFAGVVIFLILTVMVIEKTRDLGVLRSLGATRTGVVTLFLRLGMILCSLGLLLGVSAGFLFTQNINEVHDFIRSLTGLTLFPPDIYYLTRIPIAYEWADWALIIGPTILFGFLASLIPAIWAARKDPVRALRHD